MIRRAGCKDCEDPSARLLPPGDRSGYSDRGVVQHVHQVARRVPLGEESQLRALGGAPGCRTVRWPATPGPPRCSLSGPLVTAARSAPGRYRSSPARRSRIGHKLQSGRPGRGRARTSPRGGPIRPVRLHDDLAIFFPCPRSELQQHGLIASEPGPLLVVDLDPRPGGVLGVRVWNMASIAPRVPSSLVQRLESKSPGKLTLQGRGDCAG